MPAPWFSEFVHTRDINDPVRLLIESVLTAGSQVAALEELAADLIEETQSTIDAGEYTRREYQRQLATGAIAGALVLTLGQIMELTNKLKNTDAWHGELKDRVLRFRSAYGQVKDARHILTHLADYIMETPQRRTGSAKEYWYPGPSMRWQTGRRLAGVLLFGKNYDLADSIAAAGALSHGA